MIRKFLAFAATATLAAGSLVFAAAPADAATKSIYTNCIDNPTGKKLTRKGLATTEAISCTDISDLSALAGAKKLSWLYLVGDKNKKLKITGTAKLRKLNITHLAIGSASADPKFGFVKDFPNLKWLTTGTTNVSSVANIAKLKNLMLLDMKVGSSKLDLSAIARLPKLETLLFADTPKQALTPLKKSKSLSYIGLLESVEKKLKTGQTYKVPAAQIKKYSVPTVLNSIGWNVARGQAKSVKSNGPGMAMLTAKRDSKLGKINVSHYLSVNVSTSGKMNYFRPAVSGKSISTGQSVTAKKSESNTTFGWDHAISKCSYRWQRNTKDIAGATKLTYKATAADVGKTLRLKTTCHPYIEMKKEYGFTSNTKYSGTVRITK